MMSYYKHYVCSEACTITITITSFLFALDFREEGCDCFVDVIVCTLLFTFCYLLVTITCNNGSAVCGPN